MANRKDGVTEKLLDCAKAEFLDKGFSSASLRTIATRAETTPRSIYTRYGSKAGLFAAIVSPARDGLFQLCLNEHLFYKSYNSERQRRLFTDEEYLVRFKQFERSLVDYIYDHIDEFQMLTTGSVSTEYEHFQDDFIQLQIDETVEYVGRVSTFDLSGTVARELVAQLCAVQYDGLFHLAHLRLSRDEAYAYVDMLNLFLRGGWSNLLNHTSES